MKLWTQEC